MASESKINNCPFDYEEFDTAETEQLLNFYTRDFITTLVRVGPQRYFFFKEFLPTMIDIYNLKPRSSDSFVVTFPRSGTTWTQELVWLLQNDLDFETAKTTILAIRFPFIESGAFFRMNFPKDMANNGNFEKFEKENLFADVKMMETAPSPRFIKSHLPLSLLPPALLETSKVVYVARDPRDVAVSNFYHMKSVQIIPEERDFKSYWNVFMEGKTLWAPYFEHVKEAWRQKDHTNMMFIFYEELSKDLAGVARRLAKFFGKEYSDEQYEALCNHLKFDNFKNNQSVNLKEWSDNGILKGAFIRKGKTGDWREHFDEEMTQQAERWIAENLRDTDLRFPHMN